MPYLKAVLHCSRIRETGVEDSVVVISQDSWIWLSMFRFTRLIRVLTPLYLYRLHTFGCQQATTTGSASRVLELKGSKSTSYTGLRQTKQGQLLESEIHVYVYWLSIHPALCGLSFEATYFYICHPCNGYNISQPCAGQGLPSCIHGACQLRKDSLAPKAFACSHTSELR